MAHRYLTQPDGLGPPLGLYSHVCVAEPGELVLVAGQTGVTAGGEVAVGDVAAQTGQAFTNLVIALEAAGAAITDVVKTTTLLVGREHLEDFMAARRATFASLLDGADAPPNTLLLVDGLVEERFLVEVEAFAVVSKGRP